MILKVWLISTVFELLPIVIMFIVPTDLVIKSFVVLYFILF